MNCILNSKKFRISLVSAVIKVTYQRGVPIKMTHGIWQKPHLGIKIKRYVKYRNREIYSLNKGTED